MIYINPFSHPRISNNPESCTPAAAAARVRMISRRTRPIWDFFLGAAGSGAGAGIVGIMASDYTTVAGVADCSVVCCFVTVSVEALSGLWGILFSSQYFHAVEPSGQ